MVLGYTWYRVEGREIEDTGTAYRRQVTVDRLQDRGDRGIESRE